MFFVVWRGCGLAGFLPPVMGLIALGALSDRPFKVAAMGAGVVIAVTGLGAAGAGWIMNRNGNRHSLYGVPLWVWGGIEGILGLVLVDYVTLQVSRYGWKGDFRSDHSRPVTTARQRL
jgi:hypothetical protein